MDCNIARQRLELAVLSAMDWASSNVMQWGVDDCSMWPAQPLRDVFGYDAVKPWRGRYADRAGALAVLGPLGLGYALRGAAKACGWSRVDPAGALVGDIGIALLPVPTTVLCRAPGWFLARNETGYTALTSKAVRIAWAVV